MALESPPGFPSGVGRACGPTPAKTSARVLQAGGDTGDGAQDQIDEYFENYCEDVIYYYNPELQKEIEQAILKEMMRSVELSGKVSDIEKEEQAKILYKKMKNEYVNFSLKNIDSIKKIIPELFTTLPRMWLKAT